VPPPFELVTPTAITLFNNTTNAPAVQQDDTVRAERSHYFDVGVNQIIVPGLTVGLEVSGKYISKVLLLKLIAAVSPPGTSG
jgi:hypothetical protein